MPSLNKLAVVSIGNPLRGDDGIGHWIGEQVEQWGIPGVTVFSFHQLQTDLLEQFLEFNAVLIVDAAINMEGVEFRKENTAGGNQLHPRADHSLQGSNGAGSTHHLNISLLTSLAEKLFHRHLNLTVCKIGVSGFEMGAPFSAMALENGEKSLNLIRDWISRESAN